MQSPCEGQENTVQVEISLDLRQSADEGIEIACDLYPSIYLDLQSGLA